MVQGRDSDLSATNQSERPALSHQDSDSQVSDQTSAAAARPQHTRSKSHQKHVVGGGRPHARVPSSKALHKHHAAASTTKLNARRHASPSPERPDRSAPSSSHKRTTSELKLSRDSSSSNLRRNSSHTSIKRNRSHAEVAKRNKSSEKLKRSSSHKEVSKLKGAKGSVHFDLGNDEDEWIDASGSASPYLSRRGSVISGGQGSTVSTPPGKDPSRPETSTDSTPQAQESLDRETVQHKEYLTSRLLQRTPSYGAQPKMSRETVSIYPNHEHPRPFSRSSTSVPDTPKPSTTASGSSKDDMTSRFITGPSSSGATGSFYSPAHSVAAPSRRRDTVQRQHSLGDLQREPADSSITDDEDDSALAPRVRRSAYRPPPAEKSRTQQKLNLQRASSSIEPQQAVGVVGSAGVNPLVGGGGYDNRDPRISKLIERTGTEYLVVRRYQNPVARSIARLSYLPGADKGQPISRQNGRAGTTSSRTAAGLGDAEGHGLSQSLRDKETPHKIMTPRRTQSIRVNATNSSYEVDGDRLQERTGGSEYLGVSADGNTDAILRNLWEKSLDLSVSQD